eukprot:7863028-Alexandrium_andersonii.AAC.1
MEILLLESLCCVWSPPMRKVMSKACCLTSSLHFLAFVRSSQVVAKKSTRCSWPRMLPRSFLVMGTRRR